MRIGGTALSRIDKEIQLLSELAASGSLPAHKNIEGCKSCYSESAESSSAMREYFSGENSDIENGLMKMWKDCPELQKCIPVILAAVEKSRGESVHALEHTELYNYTM